MRPELLRSMDRERKRVTAGDLPAGLLDAIADAIEAAKPGLFDGFSTEIASQLMILLALNFMGDMNGIVEYFDPEEADA